jgi:hypothetical protein
MRRLSLLLVALAALAGALAAAEPVPALPPLSGELMGQIAMPRFPGLPPLAWHLRLNPAAGATLALAATATAPGFELECELTLPRGDAEGTWRIVAARIEAAAWWRLTADLAGLKALPDDFEFTGQLTLTGAGRWKGAEATGALHLALAAGAAHSESQGWSATGFTLEGEAELAGGRATLRAARVKVAAAQAAGIVAHDFRLEATGTPDGRLAVSRVEVVAFGGRVTLSPFTIDPAAPAVKSTAEFSSLALGELATLVPHALKEASGQIAGHAQINWSLQSGFGPGDGTVGISAAAPALVRLAPSPGLLTKRTPPRIELLPTFTGSLRRMLSLENPAYGMLQRIELGEVPLAVQSMDVRLYPDGPDGSRSAQVRVVARTTGVGDVIEKVTFTVNVSGPLDRVLRLGFDKRTKLELKSGK